MSAVIAAALRAQTPAAMCALQQHLCRAFPSLAASSTRLVVAAAPCTRLYSSGAAILAEMQTLSVPGRALVEIAAESSSVQVDHTTGVEQISIRAPKASEGSWSFVDSQEGTSRVISLRQKTAGTGILGLTVPDKWTSLCITSQGGDVRVSKIAEADASISTNGSGSVSIGSIRAVQAAVTTHSGSIKGTELSGSSVRVRSERGDVILKRLVALKAEVHTGGALEVAALYGDDIELSTDGGQIHLGTMDCHDEVTVCSSGGDIRVESLDGYAQLDSAGGKVDIHLHANLGDVHVSSGGGNVSIAVSPEALVSVSVTRSGGPIEGIDASEVIQSAGCQSVNFRPASVDEKTSSSFPPAPASSSALASAGTASSEPRWGFGGTPGSVTVDAGAEGRVRIVRLGWMEAVKQRMKSGRGKAINAKA